jgi:hypothetical protein
MTTAARVWGVAVFVAVPLVAAGRAADEEAPPTSLLESPEPVAAALHARFGPGVRVRRLSLQDGSAVVEVQDPTVPGNLDRYEFEDGALGPPEPVQAGRSRRALNASLFALADVDLSILPRLVADARRRADTPEPRVNAVQIERPDGWLVDNWGRPRVQVIVNGPRGGAVVEYGLDGKHRGTTRW